MAAGFPYTAVEVFAVEDVAFSWRAWFPIAPLVWLRVVDRYAAGEGLLEARLWDSCGRCARAVSKPPTRAIAGVDHASTASSDYLARREWPRRQTAKTRRGSAGREHAAPATLRHNA